MDTPISKLRVWQIWKELKHLTVSAVCEDSSTGARVGNGSPEPSGGRVDRRRDRFRPMASSVSVLSSIVPNGHQVLPTFPPPPRFIPYGGFSQVKCGVMSQKGWFYWGFRISYATFYFERELSVRPGSVETGPVCSNPYFITLECFRATPTLRWLRSGTPF
jgi:hypothetical protein